MVDSAKLTRMTAFIISVEIGAPVGMVSIHIHAVVDQDSLEGGARSTLMNVCQGHATMVVGV